MTLNDVLKENCGFSNVLGYFKEEHASKIMVSAYCEALAYIAGMHPGGRTLKLRGVDYAFTETQLIANGYAMAPLEFILVFIDFNILDAQQRARDTLLYE